MYINNALLPCSYTCVSVSVCCVLTGTVLFAPMLRHCYLSVYDRLPLQDVLIMAIGHRLVFALYAVMLRPVTEAVGHIDLGEDGSFVEQSQVSLEVEVCVHVLIGPASKALVVLCPLRPSIASIPHTTFLLCGLCRPSAVR